MSNLPPKQRGNTIAALDIGSSKIACLVAKLNNNGGFNIVSMGYNASSGIRSGIITDMRALEICIAQAVEAAESGVGERIRRIYVSVSPNILISHMTQSELKIMKREVTYKDIEKLNIDILNMCRQKNVDVVHTFSCGYSLDGNHGIINPIGMYSDLLKCNLYILSVHTNHLLNLTTCISKAGLGLCGHIVSIYASALSCLSVHDEMKLGATIIEFGAGTTSFAIFENGYPIYIDCIPLGGINITNDIAKGLCVGFIEAEKIKNLHGATILTDADANDFIEIKRNASNEGHDAIHIEINDDEWYDNKTAPKSLLVEIIRARVDEILDMISEKLQSKNITAHNKIIITGGGARLSGMRELVSHVFGAKVRIGYPQDAQFAEDYNSIEFATAIGMLMYVASHTEYSTDIRHGQMLQQDSQSGILKKLWRWISTYLRE